MRLRSALPLCALAALPSGARAQFHDSARVKRRELQQVQQQLEQRKQEIVEYQRQTDEMRRDLSRLTAQTSESRRRIETVEAKLRESERRKAELKARLGALQLAQGQWQKVLGAELNGYQGQRLSASEYYGGEDLWAQAFRRAALLEKARYVDGLRGSRRQAEVAQAEVSRQKKTLEAGAQQARAEHESRASLLRQKQEGYLQAKERVARTRHDIRELQDTALSLTHLLRALERRSPYRAGGKVPLAEPRHSLPWPVQEGRVVGLFGKQQVPELGTWIIRQGIRVDAPAGSPVRPVKAGRVIFSGPFRSYGSVLIVDHGNAFYTIYGLLGETRRRKGDKVRPGDVLAAVGAPSAEGAFYFEMRQSGDALDPLEWLQKR